MKLDLEEKKVDPVKKHLQNLTREVSGRFFLGIALQARMISLKKCAFAMS